MPRLPAPDLPHLHPLRLLLLVLLLVEFLLLFLLLLLLLLVILLILLILLFFCSLHATCNQAEWDIMLCTYIR